MGSVRNLKQATDRQTSVVDVIVDTIKEGVRLGRYVPGQRLVESDFISEMKLSRGPFREALRHLEADGVVSIEKNRGAIVRRHSREEIRYLYEIREMLETQAAKLAAERVAGESAIRARIEASRRRMRKTASDDLAEYMRENTRFHILIAEASGNPWLRRLIEMLQLPVDRLAALHMVSRGATRDSLDAHEEIIDAILAGDARRAEKLMRTHLKTSQKMIEALPDRAFD